jgi:hypothetical protein
VSRSGRDAAARGSTRSARSSRPASRTSRGVRARRRACFGGFRRSLAERRPRGGASVRHVAQRFAHIAPRGARDVSNRSRRRRDDPSNPCRRRRQCLRADIRCAGNGPYQHVASDAQRTDRDDLETIHCTDDDTRNHARVQPSDAHCRPPPPAPAPTEPARAGACARSSHGHAIFLLRPSRHHDAIIAQRIRHEV